MSERKPLPMCTPEAVGIPSGAIQRFWESLEDKHLCIHSMAIVRHGKLCAECYWKPFHKDRKHRMYSTSKSFTSAAIGILIGDGKLKLSDKVADFFPEYIPANPSPWLLEATVQDLLKMSTYLSSTSYWFGCDDWGRSFFEKPVTHKPGQSFYYDTSGTTTLNLLVTKLTGLEYTKFLEPRLFEPLGMSEDIWCVRTGCGHDWGGSGMQATTRDLAKFALCIMSGGRSRDGKQLIPEWYVKEATSKQIDNRISNTNNYEMQGYGYKFWRLPHNGFATLGMGSQSSFCFPDQDLIVVINADTQATQKAQNNELDGVFEYLFPALSDTALPENTEAQDALDLFVNSREMAHVDAAKTSPVAENVSGSTYTLTENDMGIETLRFDFMDDKVRLHWTDKTGTHNLLAGFGRNIPQGFPADHYSVTQIGTPDGRNLECLSSAGWLDPNALYLHTYITDVAFGSVRMQFVFDGDSVTMLCDKNAEWFLNEYRGFASGTRA